MNNDGHTAVSEDVVVSVEYELWVEDEMIDSASADEPLAYLHGHGNIIPGLENALIGMKINDSKQIELEPGDGYGEYDDEATAFVEKIELPGEIPLKEGVQLQVTDDDGDVTSAWITWVGADEIKLDFNHPLAGASLKFDVKIVGLRSPTTEELDHGHVHSEEHPH